MTLGVADERDVDAAVAIPVEVKRRLRGCSECSKATAHKCGQKSDMNPTVRTAPGSFRLGKAHAAPAEAATLLLPPGDGAVRTGSDGACALDEQQQPRRRADSPMQSADVEV